MPWWGWIIVGLCLLGAEMFIPLDFYLVFIGAGLILTGLLSLIGLLETAWVQWTVATVLCVVLVTLVRTRLTQRISSGGGGQTSPLEGDEVEVLAEIPPGETGRGRLRGSTWNVRNGRSEPLAAGESYTITGRDGLILIVE